ncbi:hypothetical protein TNCV_557051 [Trichonephila clavipes]|uniref:Uncharacterized protein n=1 Tax=Trichonephila clavipes TaxID=2585209 RepID=A0A8X6RVH4_TRICX|nr:hypothetical protein TNCV_557051 [Trichonephila clavipes]
MKERNGALQPLLDEVETDQAQEELEEIMNINHKIKIDVISALYAKSILGAVLRRYFIILQFLDGQKVQFLHLRGDGFKGKNQKLVSYPDNIPSAIRLIPHGLNIPVPLPPTELQKISRYIRSQIEKRDFCSSRYLQAYEG